PRRLCKHLIDQLDIDNLPTSIKKFQASIQFYQDKKKGYNKYFNELIEVPYTDFVAEYNDGDWINIFDNESNRYGFLIKDDEYIWAKSSKPKNYKIIETFFARKEYQPVVPLTGEEIKNIESSLENKFHVEEGHYVITTQERPYEIRAKNESLETYYDMMHVTNEEIFIEVQGEKYTFLRDQEVVNGLINKLIQKRLPKVYNASNDEDLMMDYEIDNLTVTSNKITSNYQYSWESKLKEHYDSAVVDKGLMFKFESFKLPRFVSEYVVSNFIEQYGLDEGILKVEEFLSNYCPKPNSTDMLHYKIQTDGEINIIDNFKVSVHIERDGNNHNLTIPTLNIKNAMIEDHQIIMKNPRILGTGLWGMGKITRTENNNKAVLAKFRPFQVSSIDLNLYKQKREKFTIEEWLEILISSIGFNPKVFSTLREKLIILSRLLPLIQKSTFLFEFGNPGTGKTYIFDKLSNNSFVISGSKITPAKLFKDCTSRTEGLLRQYEALLFDEIDKINNSDFDDEVVNKLLKFMESNSFDRCGEEMISDTSVIFSGNLSRVKRDTILPNFFSPLATKLKGEAFLDRFNGVIPGWEIKPLSNVNNNFSTTQGFSADYFSAILSELRLEDIEARVGSMLIFSKNTTNRDEKAIIKSISGFVKLIFPHMQIDRNLIQEIIDFSVELRQYIIDERFKLYGNDEDQRILSVKSEF
ncbi:MAG TPA: BREX system Lon protease-like protein BrxL, partial [Bacteroidetes bacterium]|nr:BREX system Lon protease-like protein BrxL [Bacteroidota bacterium]